MQVDPKTIIELCRQARNRWNIGLRIPIFNALWPLERALKRRTMKMLKAPHLVWGAVVQANNGLFDDSARDLPGMLVFSIDSYFDSQPEHLRNIARSVGRLKHTSPDEIGLRAFAEAITNERTDFQNEPVPYELTDGHEVFASSFMGYRQLLRGRQLQQMLFPILVHPNEVEAHVFPQQLWSEKLRMYWDNFATLNCDPSKFAVKEWTEEVPERRFRGRSVLKAIEELERLRNQGIVVTALAERKLQEFLDEEIAEYGPGQKLIITIDSRTTQISFLIDSSADPSSFTAAKIGPFDGFIESAYLESCDGLVIDYKEETMNPGFVFNWPKRP